MREVIERTQDFGLEEENGSNVSRIPAYLDSSGQPYVSTITSYSVLRTRLFHCFWASAVCHAVML